MQIDLIGKNAIVCGSTQGIGLAIAMQFAHSGAEVTLIARNEKKLKNTLAKLPDDHGQRHQYICADFNDYDNLESKIKEFISNNPQQDILVNNSGGPPPAMAIDSSYTDYQEAFNQHLVCSQILTQAVVPEMKNNQFGRIINIISTSVREPIPGLGVSNTIRGAVANWAKTLAFELAPYNITVNNILPGSTNTPRIEAIINKKAQEQNKAESEIRHEMETSVPMKRFASPEEPAYAATYLASDLASYITGINIPVDGGKLGCY